MERRADAYQCMAVVWERNIHRYSIALAHSSIHNSSGNDMGSNVLCTIYCPYDVLHSVKTVHMYSIGLTSMLVCNSHGYYMGHSMSNVP